MKNLRSEQEILKSWKDDVSKPLVSISCITYNHENFIEDALEGFLIQKTDFPFEILIHDDASLDRTSDIIREYEANYPNLIKPIYQTENQYSKRDGTVGKIQRGRAKGKYIALCEGDDYWTDSHKLQKQVNFLEANHSYAVCYHNAHIINEKGHSISKSKLPEDLKRDFSSEELIKGAWILTLSMCFRNVLSDLPEEFYRVKNGDKFLTSLLGKYGKGKYLQGITAAVYRKHADSIWSSLDTTQQIYFNGETRAWLFRYYDRIGETKYADFFQNEVDRHFNQVIEQSTMENSGRYNNLLNNIFTQYSDVLNPAILNVYKRKLLDGNIENAIVSDKIYEAKYHNASNKLDLNPGSKLIQIGNKTDELHINWIITRKCNYQCSYCTVKDNEKGFFADPESLFKAVAAISKIKRSMYHFVLSGGEPTLHPHYADLLKKIFLTFGLKAKVTTITNLSRSLKYYASLLSAFNKNKKKLRFIASYHFDHADKERFIQNLQYLHKEGIDLQLSVMAHPEYMQSVKRLYEELQSYKNERTVINALMIRHNYGAYPDKRYRNCDIDWMNSIKQDEGCPQIEVRYIDKESRQLIRRNTNSNELVTKNLNNFKGFLCNAGVDAISINANGDIDPAVCFRGVDYKKANIFNDDFSLNLGQEPIACPFEKCCCVADLGILKVSQDIKLDNRLNSETVRRASAKNIIDVSLSKVGWQEKKEIYTPYLEEIIQNSKQLPPAISIIVISWRLHPDNLESFQILDKQRDQNFELIFVDNGATAGEFDSLKPFFDTYIRLNTNTGAYLARNVGALFAQAPILFFLEDDGIPSENLIKAHREVFARYDVIAVRGVYKFKNIDNPFSKLAHHYYLGDMPYPRYSDLEGNSTYRAENFFRVGGWDDEIYFGGGGIDLAIRLMSLEPDMCKQIYSPEPVIFHDYATDGEHLKKKRQKQIESFERLRRKHQIFDSFHRAWDRFIGHHELIHRRTYRFGSGAADITTGKNTLLDDINAYYQSGNLRQTEKLLGRYQHILKQGI